MATPQQRKILELITQIWQTPGYTDMRYGQLLGNYVFDRVKGDFYWLDFTATDDQVEQRLQDLVNCIYNRNNE